MPASRRAVLVHNPRAGDWQAERLVGGIVEILAAGGFEVEPQATARPGHATDLAHRAAAAGCEAVFSLGGDGTLRETAAGLLGSTALLGPLPGGTTNVVARSLGLPGEPLAAARLLCALDPRPIDVGLCAGQPFLMQTSAGLDAEALLAVDTGLKRRFGKAAIGLAALGRWWRYGYSEIELVADGRPLAATFAAVCNLPHYGGRFRLAPGARPDDRRLDLVLFRGRGRWRTLGFARDLAIARHPRRRDVEILQVEEVELRAPADLALQVDGDPLDLHPPVTIRLAPHTLKVLAPPQTS